MDELVDVCPSEAENDGPIRKPMFKVGNGARTAPSVDRDHHIRRLAVIVRYRVYLMPKVPKQAGPPISGCPIAGF